MTSGNFSHVFITDIYIDRENRQRRSLEGLEELADSIRKRGLIHPIVVTRMENGPALYELVAGERRLESHKLLGYDQIAVQFMDELDPISRHLVELEENIKRRDMTWQDTVNAIAQYHSLMGQENEEWSQEKTADALNIGRSQVSRTLLVKEALDEGIEEVLEAPKFTTAANFVERQRERQRSSALREITSVPIRQTVEPTENTPAESVIIPTKRRYASIEVQDFTSFASEVREDQPFNFLHCDFPYGISAGDTKGQSGAKSFGGYDDRPEVYFDLLKVLTEKQDNFIAPSAHMMFWFSMQFYEETKALLTAAGWRVWPAPLIWYRSDNSGILADSNRGPRNIYETAFHCSRGDRKIRRAVGNVAANPATKKYHMSEKPTAMLEHFFRMYVDETTIMLDPTAGSGNAVKVAEEMGASWSLGLEINPDYAELAKENLGF